MRYSQLFGKNKIDSSKQSTDGIDHLFNISFLSQDENNLITLMPIGLRTSNKLYEIISNGFNKLEGQEIQSPHLFPLNILQKSSRNSFFKEQLIRFQTEEETTFLFSPEQEEAISHLVHQTLSSYQNLPIFLYQKHLQYRKEREPQNQSTSNEYSVVEGYSFHQSYTNLNNFFPKIYRIFQDIFKTCNIDVLIAESGDLSKGSEKSIEFVVPYSKGKEEIIQCSYCGYTANKVISKGIKQNSLEIPKTVQKVNLPPNVGWDPESLAATLNTDLKHITLSQIFKTHSGYVMTVIRGDSKISLDKLTTHLQETIISEATAEDLQKLSTSANTFSPMAPVDGVRILLDDTIGNSSNLVMHSKKTKSVFINCNFGLDFESPNILDITTIKTGDRCSLCDATLVEFKAIKVGALYKIGNTFSTSSNFHLSNPHNREILPLLATYTIEMHSLYLAIAIKNYDAKGLIWPHSVSPFSYSLYGVSNSFRSMNLIEKIYSINPQETLWDNREVSIEEKMKTADLFGFPYQIIVNDPDLQKGEVQLKIRATNETKMISIAALEEKLKEINPQSMNLHLLQSDDT